MSTVLSYELESVKSRMPVGGWVHHRLGGLADQAFMPKSQMGQRYRAGYGKL